MKSRLFTALCLGLAILACNKDKTIVTPKQQQTTASSHFAGRFVDSTEYTGAQFISPSIANDMISSYLSSINASVNDTDVRSFSVNADSLRAYLNDTTIKNVKLMFAHTMSYINQGNTGVKAGYQSGALTIVIAGYTSAGNYVYHSGNVLDHVAPCPYTCPNGSASNNLIQ